MAAVVEQNPVVNVKTEEVTQMEPPSTTTNTFRGHNRGRGRGGRGGRGGGHPPLNREDRGKKRNIEEISMDGSMSGRPMKKYLLNDGSFVPRGSEERLYEKLATLVGPTTNLPQVKSEEKKFNSRCRLYVGNLAEGSTVEELVEIFSPYGETSEAFIHAEKFFAFIKMDYRVSAEKARREVDGHLHRGRNLRVRFSPQSTAVRIRNLGPFVTNELLEWAFQVFGEIERAVVFADERGRSTGEGIIEFERKNSAKMAIEHCTRGCYFLTGSPRPVILEPFEQIDTEEGFSERCLRRNNEFHKERGIGPRFAHPGSFEDTYGMRWKEMDALYKQKLEALKREREADEEKLIAEMEYARYEHETEELRRQLMEREQNKEAQKREVEERQRRAEEQRKRNEELMTIKMADDNLREKEQSLFRTAQNLTSILQEQERNGSPWDAGFLGRPMQRPNEHRNQGPLMDPQNLVDFDGRSRPLHDRGHWQQQREQRPFGMEDRNRRRR